MPSVRNDTTPAEDGRGMATRVASVDTATTGTAGSPVPKQQEAHVEQECAWWALPW